MKVPKQARLEAKQLFRLCHRDGALDEDRAQRLLRRILQDKPRGYRAVLEHFRRLVEFERAQQAARVESATPLPLDLAASVQAALTQAYGPQVNVSVAVNPALIGGMRITVGSDIYDGTVQGRLAELRARFS